MAVPVYVVAGFLGAGKTTFLNTMLTDPNFNDGEKTCLIECEEGEVEVTPEALRFANCAVRKVEDEDELLGGILEKIDEELTPERIIIEYNGMWSFDSLFDAPKPDAWELAQVVVPIDGSTFEIYMSNMMNQMADPIRQADLVCFNRVADSEKRPAFTRRIMALNNAARIFYENPDGSMDEADSEPPIDMERDPLQVEDEQFGIWYIDAMQHPERYDGRKIRLRGEVMYVGDMPKNSFVLARKAMTCCVQDIAAIGFLCTWDGALPREGAWVSVAARCEKSFSVLHGADAMILRGDKVVPATPAAEEIVTFN